MRKMTENQQRVKDFWSNKASETDDIPNTEWIDNWFQHKGCTTWAHLNIEDPKQRADAAHWFRKEMIDCIAHHAAMTRTMP